MTEPYPPADDRLRHLLAQEINTSVDTWKLAFWIAGNIVKSPEIRREMARILSAHTLGRPCGDRNCEHCYDASLNVPAAVPPAVDRAARYAQAIREAGDTAYGNRPFVEAITGAVIAIADAEQTELRRERDLAIAHDRQPYPTAWAYEQACKALHRKQDAIDRVLEFAASLDKVGRELAGPDAVHPVAAHIRHLLDTTAETPAVEAQPAKEA